MLKVVTSALRSVRQKGQAQIAAKQKEEAQKGPLLSDGAVHDGRLDCVAGNGVMSELGLGDESLNEENNFSFGRAPPMDSELEVNQKNGRAVQSAVDSFPVVIVRNFSNKNSRNKDDVLDALAKWSARLVELKVRVTHTLVYFV